MAFFNEETRVTKKKPILDPEWTPLAEIGDIKSKVNLELDRATKIIAELEARGVMAQRQNVRVLKRGTIELRELDGSYVASFEPETRTIEINGRAVPSRPSQMKYEGPTLYEALDKLSRQLVMSVGL